MKTLELLLYNDIRKSRFVEFVVCVYVCVCLCGNVFIRVLYSYMYVFIHVLLCICVCMCVSQDRLDVTAIIANDDVSENIRVKSGIGIEFIIIIYH